jgi:hypothetical protein
MRTAIGLSVLAGAAFCLACGAVNERPYLTPLPNAIVDTLHVLPSALITEIEALVTSEGLVVLRSSPREGYLETKWYDTEAGRAGGERTRDPHSIVRLRFFASSIGEELTEVAAEAVMRHTLDPSLPERENERMVPMDHPGALLLNRVLAALDERFGAEPS